ncbi:MAG TPA: DUF3276 family protein [Bacteroidetes bacterium]|nr:DUF3276 family protein [Bacteroidota bacterium]
MDNHNNSRSEVYSTKIRAGKRTYFFDVKETRSSDFYITITESKRRFNGDGYDKHKIFLYKEDFNKFLNCLTDTIDHVKTELLPDYNYEEFDRDPITDNGGDYQPRVAAEEQAPYGKEAAADDDVGTTWED